MFKFFANIWWSNTSKALLRSMNIAAVCCLFSSPIWILSIKLIMAVSVLHPILNPNWVLLRIDVFQYNYSYDYKVYIQHFYWNA